MQQCACDDTTGYRTLAELRTDMMRDLGYSATASNPPPGMADFIDLKLRQAQTMLMRRFPALRTERWFTWNLTAGERFYDFPDNVERVDETCDKELDPYQITFVGYQRDTTLVKLAAGIPYALLETDQNGWPSYYDVRQCIEIWPAPSATEGTLVLRGRFKAAPFEADGDKPTIDPDLIYLHALANLKAHYGKPDAGNYVAQMEVMLQNLVAGTHATKRYIPGRNREYDLVYTAPKPTVPFP